MSVDFTNRVVAGLRARGVPVKFVAGWERRGNGQSSAYQGLIWHHTATGFAVNPPAVLWNGRSDLRGPLCNTSGNSDGSITIVAAHPANHAGASGGRSMGPLPRTGNFNRTVWGHEIVYPGTVPMTAAQYRSATILGAVVSEILGRPNAEWCRAHGETSITGKWDPGYAMGRTYDMNKMRADTVAVMRGGAPHIPGTPTQKKVKPVINSYPLHHGHNYVRVPAMVGSASGLYGRAWLSVSALGGGRVTSLHQKNTPRDGAPDGVAGARWDNARIRNGSRVYNPIPSGTEFVEVWVDVFGENEDDPHATLGFVAVEFDPK